MYRFLVSALSACAASMMIGCGSDAAPAQAGSARGGHTHTDSAGGVVVAPSTPYVAGHGGAATLAVQVNDSVAPPRADGTCEVAATAEPASSDVVVWVDGIRQGKPLPEERRYQLVSSGCALSPRVQAVVVGGTV